MRRMFFILYVILLIGCKTKNDKIEDGALVIPINVNQSIKTDISNYVDSVRFIKLETIEDNVIGFLTKVFFTDDRIVIIDREAAQIFIFDNTGNYLHKVGRRGRGPEEYIQITAGLFDPVRRLIMIYDVNSHKMLFYTLEGKLEKAINHFSAGALIRDMINLPDGNFLCYTPDFTVKEVGEKASGLWEVDSLGSFVRSYFNYEVSYPVVYNFYNSYFQFLSGGEISFRDAVSNDMYYFEGNNLKKDVTYKIKDDKLPGFKGMKFTEEKYITSLTSQDKGNSIITLWTDGDQTFYTVFSKKENNTILIYPADLFWSNLKIPQGGVFTFIDSNSPDILLVSLLGPSLLDFIQNKNASPEVRKTLQDLIQNMTEDEIINMNPILQLLYIKPL